MTSHPETPPEDSNQDKDWGEDFRRIIAESDFVDIDATELESESPSLNFIADYEALIKSLFTLRKKPGEKQKQALLHAANTSVLTFRLFVENILSENKNSPDVGHIVVELIKATNDTRAEFLSSITDQTFGLISSEAIATYEEDFPQMLESQVDLVDVAAGEYAGCLTTDIEKLYALAMLEYSGKKSTKMIKITGMLGHHALDVAKIATGVTAGIIMATKISRR